MLPRPGLPSFHYVRASTPDDVTYLLIEHGDAARLLMGGTDLFVQMRAGAIRPQVVIDLKHLPGMRDIRYEEGTGLTIGAAATLNQVAGHPDVQAHYPLLAEAANSVASYQLRNRATIGGNLANASPCADTAPATLVLGGRIVVYGPDGVRGVPAGKFFLGPGETALHPGEFISAIRFGPAISGGGSRYLKLGRTQAGDLALVSVAIHGFAVPDTPSGHRFHIALGAVAPVPLRIPEAEEILLANPPREEVCVWAAEKAAAAATPIDDVRASAAYRRAMVQNLTLRGLREVGAIVAAKRRPMTGAALDWSAAQQRRPPSGDPLVRVSGKAWAGRSFTLTLTVNGAKEQVDVPANMTLLQMLREKLALTGTKNGCAAGECGACTVLMNGEPVNACMVLASETDGAEIVTVEGLAQENRLDPLQQAFVDQGAVQCGFCTPGMLLTARTLLQRNPDPTEEEIREALVGNLCRCTGYTRIVKAIQAAAKVLSD